MDTRNVLVLILGAGLSGTACKRTDGAQATPPAAPTAAPARPAPSAPSAPAGPEPAAGEVERRIAAAQAVVDQDPKNLQAWIALGNEFFDTHQPQRAIAAYDHALELRPDQPDVLTDQGIMYRDLGLFEKALANFQKANALDPKHLQSLFNMGIVEAHDLHQPEKAVAAWRRVIEIAPGTPAAAQAQQAIADVQRIAPPASASPPTR